MWNFKYGILTIFMNYKKKNIDVMFSVPSET